MLRRKMLCCVSFVLAMTASLALHGANPKSAATDWPQFRGPQRTDNSPDKNLLTQWPDSGPPLAWTAKGLGKGFSSISIVGDKIFTMGDEKDSSFVFAVSRADGKPIWSASVGKPGGNYEGTRCTPTVDEDRVYGLGQFGDLLCVEAGTGKELWRKSLPKDFGGRAGGWNYTESPFVDGDKLLCTPGGKDSTMVALDKHTGEVIWRGVVPGGDTAGYSSIVISEAGGIRQYVQLMAGGLAGFAAADGKFLWRYGEGGDRLGGNTANIPTPIVQGEYVFTSTGYGRGGGLIKLVAADGGIKVEEIYFKGDLKNRHGGVVMVGDYVYGDQDDRGLPFCAEWKTGEVKWKKDKRTEASGSADITYADGHLYILYANGVVSLVEASPKEYKEISFFKIEGPHPQACWAHPVVIGGRLYVRDQDNLWCWDVTRREG